MAASNEFLEVIRCDMYGNLLIVLNRISTVPSKYTLQLKKDDGRIVNTKKILFAKHPCKEIFVTLYTDKLSDFEIGEEVKLFIILQGEADTTVNFEVMMEEISKTQEVNLDVTVMGNGAIEMTFVPTAAGCYAFYITIDDEEIGGFPCFCNVNEKPKPEGHSKMLSPVEKKKEENVTPSHHLHISPPSSSQSSISDECAPLLYTGRRRSLYKENVKLGVLAKLSRYLHEKLGSSI